MSNILIALAISLGINLLMFIPAFKFKTDKLTDISYAVTFVVVSISTMMLNKITLPAVILVIMIFIWAVRLGVYLFIRIQKTGRDKRFDDKRDYFWKFLSFWILQGISVWVILIPSVLFFENTTNNFILISVFGMIIWLLGLIIEAVADSQKFNFKSNPKNKKKWIESGLWKYSRHPNYLGEIMIWYGIYFFIISYLDTVSVILGLIGPVYISLLLFFVSGVPLLEKRADKKWRKNEKYIEYKKRTGVLFPKVF